MIKPFRRALRTEIVTYGMSPGHQALLYQTFVKDMQDQITKALGIPSSLIPQKQRFDRPCRRRADFEAKPDDPISTAPKSDGAV
jgi:hypothetical protein